MTYYATLRQDGARTMSGQMNVDRMATPALKLWLEKALGATATPAALMDQLRGSDLNVTLPGRPQEAGFVSVEGKFDTYTSGNMSLEIISQDRGNSKRNTPAPGWVGKDSAVVAYLFVKTGEIFFLNMRLLTPWVKEMLEPIAEGTGSRLPLSNTKPAGTPNKTYTTYQVLMNVHTLMRNAPGVEYVRMADVLGEDTVQYLLGSQEAPLYDVAPHADAVAVVKSWLTQEETYPQKQWFDCPEQLERLVRWFEQSSIVARFAQEKSRQNKASRPRLALPEDSAPLAAYR